MSSFTCQKSFGEKRERYNGKGRSHMWCNKADTLTLDRGCRLLRLYSEGRDREGDFLLTLQQCCCSCSRSPLQAASVWFQKVILLRKRTCQTCKCNISWVDNIEKHGERAGHDDIRTDSILPYLRFNSMLYHKKDMVDRFGLFRIRDIRGW